MSSHDPEQFFQPPLENEECESLYREPSDYKPLSTFRLDPGVGRHYQQQYADMYFLRLARLKPAVAEIAAAAWEGFSIAGEHAQQVDRVLDVRQGELCWVVGTVYMDLPLKPNILDDIAKENWTAAPPPRQTYRDPTGESPPQTMLEDESGRLSLTGTLLQSSILVTGAIVAVLGTENADGEFEVIDIKVPDLPPQPARWERDTGDKKRKRGQDATENQVTPGRKIAFISGLGMTGSSGDSVALSLLTDYLLGYGGSGHLNNMNTQETHTSASQISRLVIAGNSLGRSVASAGENASEDASLSKKKRQPTKKYGYDSSAYNSSPISHLDAFLAEILPSIPVTLMPGENDPANFALPQQGIHRAMLPRAKAYCSDIRPGQDDSSTEPGWLDSVTNPWEGDVEGWRLWGCSGQNMDDLLRYIEIDDESGDEAASASNSRMRLMEAMLRWRCAVPTAPDTIWCYPFQDRDPFILQSCPHVFFCGNQTQFRTLVIEGALSDGSSEESRPQVRLLSLPKFSETGEIVLLDAESLEVDVVRFSAWNNASGEEE